MYDAAVIITCLFLFIHSFICILLPPSLYLYLYLWMIIAIPFFFFYSQLEEGRYWSLPYYY